MSRERDIFQTTPAEDAENFKELWLATMFERDMLALENARLREEIAELRKPKLVES